MVSKKIDVKKSIHISEIEKKKIEPKGVTAGDSREKVKLMIFTMHGEYYAFYGENIKEILQGIKITHVPGAAAYMLGIINVRGDVESVIDITGFLGLPNIPLTNRNRISIAEVNGITSGVLLDSVEDVIDIPKDEIQPPVSTFNDKIRSFVLGEARYKNRNITLIDISKIFDRIKN